MSAVAAIARVVEFRTAIDPPWTHFEPVRLGQLPPSSGTPDRYVVVTEGGMPALRVDLYGGGDAPVANVRADATVVGRWLAIGYGAQLYLVSLALPRPRAPRAVPLGACFRGFFPLPTERALLVASGRDITRIDGAGRVVWRSQVLAADGVQIERVMGDTIVGIGEHAFPGDWRPFRLRLSDGTPE